MNPQNHGLGNAKTAGSLVWPSVTAGSLLSFNSQCLHIARTNRHTVEYHSSRTLNGTPVRGRRRNLLQSDLTRNARHSSSVVSCRSGLVDEMFRHRPVECVDIDEAGAFCEGFVIRSMPKSSRFANGFYSTINSIPISVGCG